MTAKILVDCDGVLCDTVTAYLELVREHTGRVHALADVTDFRFSKCVVSEEEDAHIWQNMIDRRPDFVVQLPELPGALVGLLELRQSARVVALTSPHIGPHWMHERAAWLMRRGFSKADIVFAKDKAHVPGTVLIDDSLDNCREWAAAHPTGTAIVFDQPWNQGDTAGNIVRACSWLEVLRRVRDAFAVSSPDTMRDRLDRALAASESHQAARGRAVNASQAALSCMERARDALHRAGLLDEAALVEAGIRRLQEGARS